MDDKRSQWFLNRRARPINDEDASLFEVMRNNSEGVSYFWQNLGPDNVAGRSTCLAVDAAQPDLVYLGTAMGGLWQSSDSGGTWTPQTDDLNTLSIGAIAIEPNPPGRLYMGTGEANLTIDSFPGLGVFRRDDRFKRIGSSEHAQLPNRIGAIAIDPFKAGHLLVGSATIADGDVSGLHAGRLDGQNYIWDFVPAVSFGGKTGKAGSAGGVADDAPYRCHSILFHPSQPGVVFAAVDMRGWRSGIWRSADSGSTWTQLTVGLPPTECFGRVSLALTPADPEVIWAYAGSQRGAMLGVFRSNNLGETWHSVGQSHFQKEKDAPYSNCIAVHPKNPDWVICGGKDLHRTKDGGRSWQQVTEWDSDRGAANFAYQHHHALVMMADNRVYDANDGGMTFSEDFGDTWQTRIAYLSTTMVRSVDVAASDRDTIACAVQNIGVLLHRSDDIEGSFSHEVSGAGGMILFDPDDSQHMAVAEFEGEIYRHTREDGWEDISPEALSDDETDPSLRPCLTIDRSVRTKATPRSLLLGTTRLWKRSFPKSSRSQFTRDGAAAWTPVSGELDGSPVSAVAISRANPRYMYAATEFGAFFRSEDGGNTWSENLAGLDLPCDYITCIQVHPTNPRHVFLTVGANAPSADGSSHGGHIFVSTDGGETWNTADPEGTLPDAAHNALAYSVADVRTLYVATDFGVYRGIAEDCRNYVWEDISGELPKAFMMDLVVHEGSQTLTVATYGRGLFRYVLGSHLPTAFELLKEQEEKS